MFQRANGSRLGSPATLDSDDRLPGSGNRDVGEESLARDIEGDIAGRPCGKQGRNHGCDYTDCVGRRCCASQLAVDRLVFTAAMFGDAGQGRASGDAISRSRDGSMKSCSSLLASGIPREEWVRASLSVATPGCLAASLMS